MEYREKFEKYLKGELTDSEAEKIQEDMEKIQVLLEHMDKGLDEELFEAEYAYEDDAFQNKGKTGKRENLHRAISRAVSRKLRKYAIVTGAVVLIIVFALIAGLSPLLDAICYNPAEQEEISEDGGYSAIICQPFQLPMAVYMELFCGDKGFANANVRPEGYGRYTLDVQTQINGKITHHPLELVRNHLYRQDMQWNTPDMPANAFTYYGREYTCSITPDEAKKRLAELPDSVRIRAAVSFKEAESMEKIVEFMKAYEALYLYIPVVVNEEGYGGLNMGLSPKPAGYDLTHLYSKEKYPYLDVFEYEGDESGMAEVLEQHMKSMLEFMLDEENEEFVNIFDSSVPGENLADFSKYKYALSYIEKNGVKGYGIVVSAGKEQLLAMLDNPEIDGVYMHDGDLQLN